MSLLSFLKWMLIKRIKRFRPFWYIAYSKEEAREFLMKNFDWKYYGGHHLENRMTAFQHSYYSIKKCNIDQRYNSLSALVRAGKITKEDALKIMNEEPHIEPELFEYTIKRLGFSKEEFDNLIKLPLKTYRDYPTYKKTFEKLKPFFWLMYKINLVPKSFYVKYTTKKAI